MNEQEQQQDAANEEILANTAADDAQTTEPIVEEISVEDKLRHELSSFKDQYLRLVAEFDNFRKRTAKEKEDARLLANKDIMQSLIAVLDDSERANKTFETATDMAAVKEGVNLILTKLNAILTAKGLKPMDTPIGADFDADLHEGITEIPAPTEALKGKVVDVIEKGYYLNDKLVRHAKVVVGN